jgi:hypothetical protein
MSKWKVFKEKVPEELKPLWVVWDQDEEHLFQTGTDALDFVRRNLDAQAKVKDASRWFSVPSGWYERQQTVMPKEG